MQFIDWTSTNCPLLEVKTHQLLLFLTWLHLQCLFISVAVNTLHRRCDMTSHSYSHCSRHFLYVCCVKPLPHPLSETRRCFMNELLRKKKWPEYRQTGSEWGGGVVGLEGGLGVQHGCSSSDITMLRKKKKSPTSYDSFLLWLFAKWQLLWIRSHYI